MTISFNCPYVGEASKLAVQNLMEGRRFAGGGNYTIKCQNFFKKQFGFESNYLTSSCTDSLEIAALLLDIKSGDEVIVPSYAFPTCALAFVRQNAKIVFADSSSTHPGIDPDTLPGLITERTKAVVVIHYAGGAYRVDEIAEICRQRKIALVEDAAQGIGSYFNEQPLGTFGDLASISFHETKNIHCGEGGLLIINNESFCQRARVLMNKGTNRFDFDIGLVPKYECVDVGSSFVASELQAAFLYGQLMEFAEIQKRRREIWNTYYVQLSGCEEINVPLIPHNSIHNSHCFYIVFSSPKDLNRFSESMKGKNIPVCIHFQPLHRSPFFSQNKPAVKLPNADYFAECLLRLPLYYSLSDNDVQIIITAVKESLLVCSK